MIDEEQTYGEEADSEIAINLGHSFENQNQANKANLSREGSVSTVENDNVKFVLNKISESNEEVDRDTVSRPHVVSSRDIFPERPPQVIPTSS